MQVSQAITRKSASNLALAFILLPKEKRAEMAALYAFCREVDDVADDETRPTEDRRTCLEQWRVDIRRACDGGEPAFPVVRELQPVINRRRLSFELFNELLCGVEMDLDIKRYRSFPELEQYCYRVASVVGLLSIEIFTYRNAASREYAIFLGKALQLTNILRDVRHDAERGRIYLPEEWLEEYRVSPSEILALEFSSRFARLAERVAETARQFYRRARETLPAEDRRSMATAELMGSVYWQLLQKLQDRQFNVFDSELARLGRIEKLFLILRTGWRAWTGTLAPNYGVR